MNRKVLWLFYLGVIIEVLNRKHKNKRMATSTTLDLLKEQCNLLEEYANAQSRLLNVVIVTSSSSIDDDKISSFLEDLDDCRCRVRSNWKLLQAQDEIQLKYPSHITLSSRVLQTIAKNPSWHTNGISRETKSALEANTVALAAVKASVALICESNQP